MTTLTFNPVSSGGDFTCPPKETYILELTNIGEMEERVAYGVGNEHLINTQARLTFTIRDYDYDSEFDEQDWNGTEVSDFYVFFKFDQQKQQKYDTWCHEKSKVYPMLTALVGHEPSAGEGIDLAELVGKRVKATVEPKESGYPKISNPIKYRQRRPAKVEAVTEGDEADEPEQEAPANPFQRKTA